MTIKETNQLGFKNSVFPTNKETIYLLTMNEIINHSLANMKNISVIGERFQNKGYAFEALQCIIKEYLMKRDMYMLEAKYNISNLASGNLLKKLGFQLDGELRNRRIDIASGERKNLVICSITKEDFLI